MVSPRQVSALRFDFENATVELDHLYGYTDHDLTVTATAGFGDDVAAAWSEDPAGQPSSHLAQLTARHRSRSRLSSPRRTAVSSCG
ncbi:hypothetical protein ACFPJ1_12680 [Kribbella qitaiheensis]|uniref:hypothetical protein n=1 Tax=Kribbella qitaiheensis TaxID=1544730 RepID=UPI003612C405